MVHFRAKTCREMEGVGGQGEGQIREERGIWSGREVGEERGIIRSGREGGDIRWE